MLTWTTVKPTKAGWYWVRGSGELLTIVRLISNPHGEFTAADAQQDSLFLEHYRKIANGRDRWSRRLKETDESMAKTSC